MWIFRSQSVLVTNLDPLKCPNSMNTNQLNFQTDITPALLEFMCNNHTDLNDCVDFVCNVFDLDATDELIDSIADEFDAFFGN